MRVDKAEAGVVNDAGQTDRSTWARYRGHQGAEGHETNNSGEGDHVGAMAQSTRALAAGAAVASASRTRSRPRSNGSTSPAAQAASGALVHLDRAQRSPHQQMATPGRHELRSETSEVQYHHTRHANTVHIRLLPRREQAEHEQALRSHSQERERRPGRRALAGSNGIVPSGHRHREWPSQRAQQRCVRAPKRDRVN